MDCEYELRCTNGPTGKDKCYRCNGSDMLKLPEDKTKQRKAHKVKDESKAQAKDSWKMLEQDVADRLSTVPTIKDARRSIASGALWFEKGDVVDFITMPECKERQGTTLKCGERSFSIKRDWMIKAKAEAQSASRTMIFPVRFKGDEDIYALMDFEDMAELITLMKSYITDNSMKAKEIEALKSAIKRQEGIR